MDLAIRIRIETIADPVGTLVYFNLNTDFNWDICKNQHL
jgi:hypothetical protein